MRCPSCNHDNSVDASFCDACGAKLESVCATCGSTNQPGARFCKKCGTRIATEPAPAKPAAASPAPKVRVTPEQAETSSLEGERKTVTALFADIKGSTELEQDLDPEEARAIIDPALKLMIDAVRRYDGYIVQSTGDGIFALFGAPVAHEDHPQRALYAALRMQEELRRYGSKLQGEGRAPIEIRVGANTGEVVVRSIATGATQVEYTPIGHTTNLASRLQSIARTGSIVASESTRKFCEGYFVLKPLGPTKVKGVSEPVNVYEVTGLGPLRTRLQQAAGRGFTKFVGREREMDALKRAAEAASSSHGQIVAAMAEAGVGKSRLYYEFKAVAQSRFMVLETFSVSHGKATAFLPVIELLWNYFRIGPADDARIRREKVTGRVLALDRTLEDTLPFLFKLLGLTGADDPLARMEDQIKQRRMLEAIKRLVLRESLNQPLMMIVEDLHWVDSESEALLNLLADSIGTAKILMLVNYRPEYSHHWSNKTYYTHLRLDPLGKESADEMLSALLGDATDLAPLKRLIVERTDGNPFFMEETVQVLLDDGGLVRDGSALKLTRPLADLKIPPTVQAILAARIDRLPAAERELLHTLAIVGKEFQLGLVREVLRLNSPHATDGGDDDQLNRMLAELQLAEFIYEQPSAGDVEYTFKHALTHEVAYNSVLTERRKAVHERTAQAVERTCAAQLDDHLAELAHHYRRSGNAAKAIDYLVLGAQQAISRGALTEGRDGLKASLELLEALPPGVERMRREAAIQVTLGRVFGGPASPEVEEAYLRARELCLATGDRELLFQALSGLRLCYHFRAELERALATGQELLAEAERTGDAALLVEAHWGIGQTQFSRGEFIEALDHYRQAGDFATAKPTAGRSVFTRSVFTVPEWQLRPPTIKWVLGYPDQARRMRREALESLRSSADPLTRILSELSAATLSQFLRKADEAAQHSAAGLRMAVEYGSLQASGFARLTEGWAIAESGDPARGMEEIGRALQELDRAGTRVLGASTVIRAECHLRLGQIQEGLEVVSKALVQFEQSEERAISAEVNRLKGELLAQRGPRESQDAEAAFRTAIDIARQQHAKSWELRATTSLARLLDQQGKRDEARTMLADIYNWFTEGFDTADLKDAKALLDQLSG